MFSDQFYEERLSVRERNMKLLLETATYIAIKESHLHNCNRQSCAQFTAEDTTCLIATETPICIITIKIVTHIFAAETVTCICAVETSNCITVTKIVSCVIVTERPTNIPVTESNN